MRSTPLLVASHCGWRKNWRSVQTWLASFAFGRDAGEEWLDRWDSSAKPRTELAPLRRVCTLLIPHTSHLLPSEMLLSAVDAIAVDSFSPLLLLPALSSSAPTLPLLPKNVTY